MMNGVSDLDVVVLSTSDLGKTYGGTRALDGVNFDLRQGEVHAILGENGAGKSTLINCLTGAVAPDSGSMTVGSQAVTALTPSSAQDSGIAVVRQELSLFPSLSVAENLIGTTNRRSVVSWRKMNQQARELLDRFGLDIDPRFRLEQLSIGQQQLVEIAKALFSGSQIIFLDEPTSSLGTKESELLFNFVHELTGQGVSFILITHFLDDAVNHSDRITIFRDGRKVITSRSSDISKSQLVEYMIGDSTSVLSSTYADDRVVLPKASINQTILEVTAASSRPEIKQMSLTVRAGEIVGMYGDLSSGAAELADVIFGMRASDTAKCISVDGVVIKNGSPVEALKAGVGFIPADRREALALDQSITWNTTLAHLKRLMGFFLKPKFEMRHVEEWSERLRIRGASPRKAAGALSGGNQQKILFARWLDFPPKILVLVEPTRGMDVGAKSDVLRIVKSAAEDGTAVLVISSEPETVMSFAHRVLIAKRGEIVAEFSDCEITKQQLIELGH